MSEVKYFDVKRHNNLKEMLEESVSEHAEKVAFWVKKEKGGDYLPITYREFKQDVDALGTAMIAMGLKNKKIAVIGENSYEWAVAYMATVNGVGCIVPLDKELPEHELENLLNRSKAEAIYFTDLNEEKIMNIYKRTDVLNHCINMSGGDLENGILDFRELISKGKELLENSDRSFLEAEIDNEAMSMLMFTSGTTAKSKGVMLSHKNYCTEIQGILRMVKFTENDVFFSIVPYHHNLGQIADFLMPLSVRASIGHCEGLRYIAKNMQELKPSVVSCAPAIAEMFLRQIWGAIEKAGKKEQIEQLLSKSELTIEQSREIFKEILQGFGGELRVLPCSGASLPPEVAKGLRNFGIDSAVAYGLTETTAGISISQLGNLNNNSVGILMPGVQMSIDNPNKEGVGEFLLKWDGLMIGYYEDEQSTKEALTEDGFLRTGDLGYVDKDGFLYISGRKKNVIITKNGRNVFPEELEEVLLQSQYIKECLVFEKELKTRVKEDLIIAVSVFPDFEKITTDFGDIDKAEISRMLKDEIAKFNESLPPYKAIKHLDELRETPFPRTTSGKIKRYLSINKTQPENMLDSKEPNIVETVQETKSSNKKNTSSRDDDDER